MFVKPAPHPEKPDAQRRVRIPHTYALLANDGEDVPDNAFWLRRRMHGDVVDAERPKLVPAPVETPTEIHAEAAVTVAAPAVRAEAPAVAAQPEAHAAAPAPTAPPAPATGTGA